MLQRILVDNGVADLLSVAMMVASRAGLTSAWGALNRRFDPERTSAAPPSALVQPFKVLLQGFEAETKRPEFLGLVGGAAVSWPFVVRAQHAQQTERPWRISVHSKFIEQFRHRRSSWMLVAHVAERYLGRIGSRAALYEHLLNLLALCGLSG